MISPSSGACKAFRLSWTDRNVKPSTHHRQIRPAAVIAKTANAQSCTVPNARVVITIITQIVRKARRLESVCRRLAESTAGLRTLAGRARGSSTTESLEVEVVIPNAAENRTNGIVAAGFTIERQEDALLFGRGPESQSHQLPIVRTPGCGRRRSQHLPGDQIFHRQQR